jgi:hypothetical protein
MRPGNCWVTFQPTPFAMTKASCKHTPETRANVWRFSEQQEMGRSVAKKNQGGHLDSIDPAEASSCLSRLFHLIKTLLANHYFEVALHLALFSHKGFAQ